MADQLPPVSPWLKKTPSQGVTTLEGLVAVNKSQSTDNLYVTESNRDSYVDGYLNSPATIKDFGPLEDKHVDVKEDQGWITIPFSTFLPSIALLA